MKRDPVRRWALPDRAFFAAGACHILAHAFLDRHGRPGMRALWIRPAPGFTMNHIVVDGGAWIFDWRGYARRDAFLAHTWRKARRWWPGWDAALVELLREVLVSEPLSRTHEGLWLREPGDFLHDAGMRARAYLDRFPAPPSEA
ncbi:hypothetical protein J5Y10_13415 [Roseomonas sp. SG15]|uniref:Uncharacterized protein n=1 Tax=Roseomonas indoligenes TaxID=2820811 RepID=A0A940S6B2_9PROT|nr:hypothetical protein [Pararoseomonas indoligenes]